MNVRRAVCCRSQWSDYAIRLCLRFHECDIMPGIRSILKLIIPQSLIMARRERIREQRALAAQAREVERRHQLQQSLCLSQAGQDLWVYGSVFNEKRNGFFLDVGAHDGVYLSNTFILETRYGWNGILIEGNPATFEILKSNRSGICANACVSSGQEIVQFRSSSTFGGIIAADCDNKDQSESSTIFELETVTLESILSRMGAPLQIDYLSIDIEGAEDRALLDFPFEKYRFTCITIERPSAALRDVFDRNGYRLVAEIPGLDCFYIHGTHVQTYFDNTLAFYRNQFQFSKNQIVE